MALNPHEIRIRFAPVKVDRDRVAMKDRISAKAEELALLINELVPGSREESQAVKAVEVAVHWAHGGIDRRYVARGERHATEAERQAAAEASCLQAMAQADIDSRPDRI